MKAEFLTFLAVLALSSCLKRPISEPCAVLNTDSSELVIASEDKESGFLTDTLLVTSNRSWTLETVYNPESGQTDWITLEQDFPEQENIGHVSVSRAIPLIFTNNRYNRSRSANLVFHFDGRSHTVNVVQGGITYRMETSVAEINDISDVESIQSFHLDTNVPWQVSVQAGATADVEVLTPSGDGPADISVKVGDNDDDVAKEAVIVIGAVQGFDISPVKVTLRQKSHTPFLSIDRGRSRTSVCPISSVDTVFFSTNAEWTARLEDASEGISLTRDYGTKRDSCIIVDFGTNCGSQATGSVRSARLVIEAGGLSEEIAISQEYWWRVGLVFHNGSGLTPAASWPLLSPLAAADIPGSSSKAVHKGELVTASLRGNTDMTLSIYATSGIYRNSNSGLVIKGNTGDYIAFSPVVDRKLVAVCVASGTTSFRMELTDNSGTVVDGGQYKSQGWTPDVPQYWMLSGTAVSTGYRWSFVSNTTVMIHSMEYFFK